MSLIWASWISPYDVSVTIPSAMENQTRETDSVGAESLQTGIAGFPDQFRPVIDGDTAFGRALHAALRGEKDLVAAPPDALADETLVRTVLIDGRRIQVGHANIERVAHGRLRLRVVAFAVPADEPHTAEADRRYLFARGA